ncbi:hypothetical protein FSP39_021508 [Pinctada imbricata]|uniref:Reverse transcriptase domain-containing protein n=1 Tax=Pinctada imbricata TaxID=66713 RepID=A0AA89CE57_PINIB|nr:hypothetical protein FSP39_021508 [Pinctada imbricata]
MYYSGWSVFPTAFNVPSHEAISSAAAGGATQTVLVPSESENRKSSLSKQEILEKANQLRNDITDRCLEKDKVMYICMMQAFIKGNDIKSAIDTTIFLLDEFENESRTNSLGSLFHLLHALHDDKQRGFHHAVWAWRIITPRVQCFKPGLAEFDKLLQITFDCGIGSEEEFQKMLQETAYPCSFDGCWNGSKGHDVKKCASFAFIKERGEKDLTKVEPTKFPLGTENYHRNKESQLKNIRSEFNEVVELVEKETFQEKGERKSTELPLDLLLHALPSNVEREHKISDILNPFETLPSIIRMPRIVTWEDRMNLLGGPKEFLIRMEKAGIVPNDICMVNLLKFIPMTHVVESSLLILSEDTDPKSRFTFYGAIVDRILKRKDNAAAKCIDLSNPSLHPLPCECSSSDFNYSPCGHVITGDLSIVKNDKLRELLKKGSQIQRNLDKELGLNSTPGNPTYTPTNLSASEIIDNHKSALVSFGFDTNRLDLVLPYLYCIPKMHKNPYKQRFIAGFSKCYMESVSILLTKVLSEIKSGLQKYCSTVCSRSGINQMWILKNSKELLEHLKSTHFSRVHSIKAFDFSTLYTTIQHSKLRERLAKIISNAFTSKNGNRKYKFIVVNYDKTYFVKEKSDSENKYTETDIIQMLNFLIGNIFVVFGGKVFQQIVGIPMGTNCALLLADIFLYSYEAEFIQSLVSDGKRYLASDFNFTYRYKGDVLSINNPKFTDYLSSIYPSELEVKETSGTNNSASYLDIMLSYDSDGHMNTSLYDKRDDFNFSITNFPFLSSNIPSSPAYGVFISQLIRYVRASTKYTDLVLRARRLSDKLLSQGYVFDRLTSLLRKFYDRYGELVIHCDVPLSNIWIAIAHIIPLYSEA